MIEHIVLYELNDVPAAVLQKAIDCYEQCKEEISGFVKLTHGWNVSPKVELSGGFHYGWIMTFESRASISEYNTNKWHTKAKEALNGYLGKKLIFDIEA